MLRDSAICFFSIAAVLDGAAAETTARAEPLTQPSQPTGLVALRSWGSALKGKIWGFF